MTLYLTRYFLNEFSAWVLFTPLIFVPILLLSLGGDPFPFIVLMTIYSCAVVFSKFQTIQLNYQTILHIAPIRKKTIVQVNLLFLSGVAALYSSIALITGTLLHSVLYKSLVIPNMREFAFLIGCCLLLIVLNCWRFHTTATNAVLIINFFAMLSFTSINISQLAHDSGYMLCSVGGLLLVATFIILRGN